MCYFQRLACLLVAMSLFTLTGCSSVSFAHPFGEPVSDERLALIEGVWIVSGSDPGDTKMALQFFTRPNGWIEVVTLKQHEPHQGEGAEPDPDIPPKPTAKIFETRFMQIREFDRQYYAWVWNKRPQDKDFNRDGKFWVLKIAGNIGGTPGDSDILVLWRMDYKRLESAVNADELEGYVNKDEEGGAFVSVTSNKQALEKFAEKTSVREWFVLEEPHVLIRLTKEKE